VGIELRRPLQNTCLQRSSASRLARLAACRSAWLARWKTHSVNLRSTMIMSNRDLLCIVLEILGLIFVVTICIVLAASIELHPVGALHDADSGQTSAPVPQRASKQSDKYSSLMLSVLAKLLPKRKIGFLCNMAGKLPKLGDSNPFTCKFEQFPVNIFLIHLCFLTSHPSLHQGPFHLAIQFPLRFGNLRGIRIIIIGFHLAIRIDSAGPTIVSRFWRSEWRLWVRGIHALFVLVARHCPKHKHKIKIGLRGTYGSCAIFKFQDIGPRAGRLKGCAIHWSRGNAVLQCQQVSFRARAWQRHMCAPRRDNVRKLLSKFPERPGACPAKFPEQKCAGFFSKNHGEKSGENGEKFRYDMKYD
jgi:hypothetical protein